MKKLRLLALSLLFLAVAVPASAKDEWVQVRSKNFFLIGNASEKDIRKVATRLEQFRETFRQLFTKMNFSATIPTNVVVFKSDGAFRPFKPKRSDGKTDNFLAGYFQSGEDVNYIALSTEREDGDMFSVIFHEYVHFIVNTNFGKSEVPPWFNEGLAEYYETFQIEEDQKVKLGLPQSYHLQLLNENKLIPLDQLFKISNYQLHETGNHSRSIFYAESWALIHYLIQSGKSEGLGKFLNLLLNDAPPEKAFQDAFQMTYPDMEKELRKYVGQNSYKYNLITFKNKLTFDTEMHSLPLPEAESTAYLGDLLYHTNRSDDAEPFLMKTLASEPDSSMANTTLGMVKMRQRKFDDAKQYLEKAVAQDQKNYLALYRYAYLLSREGRDEFGYVRTFPADSAAKMRDLLKKAIAINPAFTESYELLAFVDLVNNEQLDDALVLLKTALKYQPGNQSYAMRIADIYLRQNKFDEASAIATKIARTTDDAEIKSRAENLVNQLNQRKDFLAKQEEMRKQYGGTIVANRTDGPPILKTSSAKEPTQEELDKQAEEENIRSINRALRKPLDGEKHVVGQIQTISCKARPLVYSIVTADGSFTLTSKDFQGLTLMAFAQDADHAQIDCDAKLSTFNAVLTYKEQPAAKGTNRGELVAVEFVPKTFRLMEAKEIADAPTVIDETSANTQSNRYVIETDGQGSAPTRDDFDAQRRAAMMQAIKSAIKTPGTGEKRELGYIDKTECNNKGIYFYLHTDSQSIKLYSSSPRAVAIRLFTPELEGLQFGCAMKPVELPAVVIYKDTPDQKAKTTGEILSLDFVPKTFVLDK